MTTARNSQNQCMRTRQTIPAAVLVVLALVWWSTATAAGLNPAIYGQWSSPIDAQVVPVHMQLLPTGQVLYWQEGGDHEVIEDEIRLWDPATGSISTPALPNDDIFCSGHTFLADGTLLVAGGHLGDNFLGVPASRIYNPFANTWRRLPDMNEGRWYPTTTTLPYGDVLVVSGSIDSSSMNTLPQVWQVSSGAWRDLTGATRTLPLYPFMLVAPNGQVFYAGQEPETYYLDTADQGGWTFVARSNFGFRDAGSAVMYDNGKVLIVGGSDGEDGPVTNTAEVIDLNAATPAWHYTSPMAFARKYLNAVALPDGKVFVPGGTSTPGFNDPTDAVLDAELWDPATGHWSTMAAMQFKRIYHSTAVLLPDGRVLVGGGGRPAPIGEDDRRDFEIYSPPYLFQGARPTITSTPATVTYGQPFFVQTPDAPTITHVTWIRLPAVTHAFDQNQRLNRLSFSPASGGLQVTAPASANLSPPGHYMLFILNGNGVPSVARMVQITDDTTPPSTTLTEGPTGTIAVPSVSFTWTGTDNITPTASLRYAFRLDPLEPSFSAFGSATSQTYTGLANGTYTFLVKAQDQAGHEAVTPARRSFTVAVNTAAVHAVNSASPTVTIATPTSSATYSTSSSPLALGGTAADNVGVTQVTWSNDRGGSGTASGTTIWTAGGVTLQSGVNVLTVTAHNAAGDMGSATITVIYTPRFNTRIFKDVNGDSKADLVWRHSITGDVAVWLLNGTTMIGGGVVGSAGDLNWQLVGVGDVNGDSKADLVWRHLSTGQVAVWLLDGPTLAGAAVVGSAADLNWQLE